MLLIPRRTVSRSTGLALSIARTPISAGSFIAAGLLAARPLRLSNVLLMRFRSVLCCRFPCLILVWLMPLMLRRTNSAMSLCDPVVGHCHRVHPC